MWYNHFNEYLIMKNYYIFMYKSVYRFVIVTVYDDDMNFGFEQKSKSNK